MTALAVMAALIGAMFVSLQSVSAADLGACSSTAGTTNYLVVGDTCSVTAEIADGDTFTLSATGTVELSDDGTDRADETPSGLSGKVYTIGTGGTAATELVVRAISPGKVTVTDSAGTPAVYTIEVVEAVQFAIVMDDSDETVKAGTPVKLAIAAKGARGADAGTGTTLTVRLDVPSTGLYFTAGTTNGSTALPAGTTSQRVWAPSITIDTIDDGAAPPFTADNTPTLSTAGAPDGEYTITATITDAAGRLELNQTTTATLTIGDAGAAIGSATLALDTGQKASVGKSDSVTLVVTSKNSRGENSNPGEVNTVTLFAPFGSIAHGVYGDIAAETAARNSVQLTETDATPDDTTNANPDDVGAVTKFTISSQSAKARTIDVYAIVIGADGSKTTEPLTLTFTGAADAIALGDASGTLLDRMTDDNDFDMIHFALSATDKAGNPIGNPTVSITVTGPDDKDATSKFDLDQVDLDPDKAGDDQGKITVASQGTATAPLAVGEYTLKVKSRTNAKVEAESTFTVVNTTEVTVVLEVSNAAPDSLGDTVTVTATVTTDEDGNNPVPEKTEVTFTASDTSADNDHVLVSSTGDRKQTAKTKAGVAKANFIAVGTGNAVISVVTAGGGNVTVIQSTAGSPAVAVVEPDPALASISLEVVGEDHSAGRITVLASLADADDEPVEGMVSFYSSGDASLFGPTSVVTSDGTATAVYDAKDDFTVLAVAGSHRTSVSIAVTSAAEQAAADQAEADRIAAEEAAAEAEAERMAAEAEAERIAATVTAETERLSGVSGFTSWLAEGSTTASELFAALSAEGATALHVWNGTSWVRYSVVDGTTVPGSFDFDIERGDVLFISN